MQVTDLCHARDREQRPLEQRDVDSGRRALHQNVDRLLEQDPRALHDEQPDAGADQRVSGSASFKPVNRMMPAAASTPSEPSMSPSTSK